MYVDSLVMQFVVPDYNASLVVHDVILGSVDGE